jgi:hypothetical protein
MTLGTPDSRPAGGGRDARIGDALIAGYVRELLEVDEDLPGAGASAPDVPVPPPAAAAQDAELAT